MSRSRKSIIAPWKYISTLLAVVVISLAVGCGQAEGSTVVTEENNVVVGAGSAEAQVKDIEEDLQNTEAKVHFIDTGNSDAILIMHNDKTVLIDAGDNDDEALMVNYLNKVGVTKINYLINTHPDADHCGGMDAVIDNFDIEYFFVGNGSANTKTYTDVITAAANKGVNPSVPLEESIHKLTDTSYIQFFNVEGTANDANESSLVTLFVNGQDKFLFTGDIGEKTENKILSQMVDVDVLKIGHHGSKHSTCQEFLDKVNPEYAVIQTGKNSYGHPHEEVLTKLKDKNIEVHRSDECGDVIFISSGDGVKTDCIEGSFIAGAGNENNSSSSEEGKVSETVENPKQELEVTEEAPVAEGEFVITMQGEKYHKPSCSTIKQEKARVSREEAESEGYSACGRCKP